MQRDLDKGNGVDFMNIQLKGSNNMFFANSSIFYNSGLKSTQQRMQRQAESDNQIAFLENQKNNLKNMECESLEEISRKLDMLHSYEDQIADVKKEYNNSQMFHAMDEAMELGEKIAKAAEKYAPKTEEERKEEMVEEALGIDEEKGELTESMEELSELAEEMTEELAEELTEEITEEMEEEAETDMQELPQVNPESEEILSGAVSENASIQEQIKAQSVKYKRIDVLI